MIARLTALVAVPQSLASRVIGAAIAMPTSVVLGLSAWLTPDPKGYETHLQLGLKPCIFLHLTGYPCPMCGMTTTFALLAHGRPIDALFNQPFGLILFAATAGGAVVGWLDVGTGGGWTGRASVRVQRHERRVAWVLLVGMLVGWVYKILLMHPELLSNR